MQMTAEQKTLMTRIGLGVVAVVLVAAITVTIAHLLNPQAKPTVTSTSSHVASTTPTAPATIPTEPVGSTQSVDSLMNQDATSEDSINAAYENNNVAASQAVSQAAANVGSAYNESNF
jgi:hypothetical protein